MLGEIRSWVQHREALCFIFSGLQTLNEIGPNWSNYSISVQPVEMLYLEPDAAHELLLHPDPDTRTLTPVLTDSLQQGIAFFNQVWCGFYSDQSQFRAEIGELRYVLLSVAAHPRQCGWLRLRGAAHRPLGA